ncbi:autotransporter-associated beta strand repeat-containing protein [Luteolibacter arcticus]|uniref:Autotransporter-associated beta strand repeat-containing protein n=1 Tax=Luteolibacter arcticus TaxID=1581411 RepID=A0ABT3GFT7_9BACT|nr:autotransporter-associated beta strand repeat-containing protein [Luteolibacter arcticus]MCW1922484.1 autotransporter-associated beta strand repeat-containing protein [Luteolibacter arcticus]
MKPNLFSRSGGRLALLLTAAALPAPVFAALTWNSAGPTGNWSTAVGNENWNPGPVVWTPNEDAIFDLAAETVTVTEANTIFDDITFGITGFTLANDAMGSLTLSNDFASTITVTNLADTATIAESLANNGVTASSLTKAGAGTLVLSGTNGYTGGTNVSGGTLSIAGSANLGAGTLTFNGGNLTLTGTAQTLAQAVTLTSPALITTPVANTITTFSGLLSGAGALSVTGSGALAFTNTGSTYSGGVTLNNSVRLQIGTNAAALGGGAGTVTVNGTSTPTSGSGSQVYASGAVTLAKNFIISGSGGNSVDSVQRGAIRLDTGAIVSGNITLSANASIGSNTGGGTVSGVISGTGFALTKVDGNTLTLTANNTYTGGTTVHAGALTLGGAAGTGVGRIRGTVTVNSGTTLNLTAVNALGYTTGVKVDTVNLSGTLDNTAAGDNGWGVTYNLTGGTLRSNGGTSSATATQLFAFGSDVGAGGTVVNSLASATTSTVAGRINIRQNNPGNAVAFTVADGAAATDLLVSAAITQASAGYGITKNDAGLMSLTGASSFTGATTVNGGTLLLGSTGTLPSSAITVNSTGSFISSTAGKTFAALTANNGSTLGLAAQTGATTTVTGALTLTTGGNTTIALQDLDANSQTIGTVYDLVTAGSIAGTGSTTLSPNTSFGPTRVTGTTAVAGNKLQLTITGAGANLIWNNASAAGVDTGTWDLNTTANFNNGGSNDVFKVFDAVTFDDSLLSGSPKTVNLTGTLAPAKVTVNNSAGDYTLTSTGTLSGGGSLVKSGTSKLTLTANHTNTGTTTVNGGTLQVGANTPVNVGSLGTGAVSIASGSTVNIRRSDGLTFSNAFSGAGNLTFTGTNNGSGENTQTSHAISGNNSGFSGTMTAEASRLALDSVNDVGTANLVTGTNGQFFITAGTYANNFTIAGDGWGEGAGQLGAIRLSNSSISGTITLAGNSRISTHSGTGAISGPIVGSGFGVTFGTLDPASAQATNLTLSGASTYTGATTIGHNLVSTANITLTGSLGATAVTVNPNSSLNGGGSIATGGSLTFGAGATGLGVNAALANPLTVGGNVNFNGAAGQVSVTVTPGSRIVPGSPFTLLSFTGTTDAVPADFTLVNPANFRAGTFAVTANAVTLDLATKALTWTGTGGLNWAIGGAITNWNDTTPAPSTFFTGDGVTFDDTAGAANGTVTLVGALVPLGLVVNNTATVPYTFTGTGTIGGATSLVKQGVGALTIISAQPTYTGGTTVNGGSIIVDSNNTASRLPNGGSLVINNTGTLVARGTNPLPQSGNALNTTVNAGGTLRFITGTSIAFPTATQSHGHLGNLTLNGGTVDLTYAGAGNAYNDESFQLVGNVTVGGAAASTIQSSEAAALQGMALVGVRTFTVADATGSAAADLTISAEVENSDSNNGALIKAGVGTMSLIAANSYTAGTTVNAGTLLVTNTTNSGTGTGAVTVNTGGTLGGTGAFTGALTVNAGGTVAPGTSAGDLAVGATVIAGTYACEVNGATEDTLVVTGALNITGATLNVSAIGDGATAGEYIIATYTGALTGTFSGLAEGATVLPGYTITYATAGQIKLVTGGPSYSSWAASFSPNPGLANVDFENDGFENGTEFILGGSPISGSNNPKIYSFAVDTNADLAKELVMTIAVPVGTPAFSTGAPSTSSFAGFGIAVQGSMTLASYPLTVTPVTPVTTNLPTLTPQGGVSYEYRSFSLGGSNGLPSKGFLRVSVTNP